MKRGIPALAAAIAVLFAGQAQAETTSAPPFQIVEASIDDIHAAFRSGKLTARQLIQGYLDRIAAYDKQGPTINSVISALRHVHVIEVRFHLEVVLLDVGLHHLPVGSRPQELPPR